MFVDRRFLVTGATGFIGATLTRRLVREGAEVHVLVRASSDLWRLEGMLDSIQLHQVDLRDADRLRDAVAQIKPTIIYHCAAFGGYPDQTDAELMLETNLRGTLNLLRALTDHPYECLVNTGSSSEYGLKTAPMREDDRLEPVSFYGVTKVSATLACQATARATGRPIVTLRPFSPFGPYEEPTRLIPTVIMSCLLEKDPELTSGDQVRDFIFVEDVVDCFLRLAETRLPPGEIINVGGGRQHTVREVVERIIALCGASVSPKWGTIPKRPHEATTWVADISKAKTLLHWQPSTNLDEGLQKTIAWFKEHMSLYASA